MKVLKFGSASIANVEKIKHVASIIAKKENNIVVLSSIKGTAELLSEISKYFYNKNVEGAIEVVNKLEHTYNLHIEELFSKEENKQEAKDYLADMILYLKIFGDDLFTLFEERALMSQGELISSFLICLYLNELGVKSQILPALDFMRMDRSASPDMVYIKDKIQKYLPEKIKEDIYLTQGYICRNSYGEIDDLRKGGSDYSAAIIGAAVGATEIQIWGDNDVMLNNDPKYVANASIIKRLSFDEAAELAYFGSKILHPTCVLPAKLAGIPIRLMNTQKQSEAGTVISNETETGTVKAIGARDNITAIKVKSGKMLLAHGFLRKIFEVFEKYQTSIDMLASSEIGVSVTIDNCKNLPNILDELKQYGTVSTDTDMVIISVVGDFVMKNENIGSNILDSIKMVPVRMVSYGGSNLSFSFLIEKKDKEKTLQILNERLFN